ncbi:hypothetical protein JOL79_26700 [Microbispora sp. RL4-1S]|uniref:Uncharacterized protein n=1 Tax=Microbispora oryzae TaxID=2806554 RepID=A0A941AKE0_9ACTN|nr:hypothetical protein [Microbispora oryzae]MBP2707380.1 hypothetical protein [Microbispora oryzae]
MNVSLLWLVLCLKGIWPPRAGATTTLRFRRVGADGQPQEYRLSVADTGARERWTQGDDVLHDGAALMDDLPMQWCDMRVQELIDTGWEFAGVNVDIASLSSRAPTSEIAAP